MDVVSYCLIMFLLFGNRDNTVGYYQFPQSSKLLFPFLCNENEMYSELVLKCIPN